MKSPKDQIFKKEICFRPIGVVENEFFEPAKPDEMRATESRIVLRSDLVEALDGMQPGQKLFVLFFFHRSDHGPLMQHPRGDESRAKRGVFMLRSPNRPNPIGLTEVELIKTDHNVLHVRGLDAIHDSPVLDIKPA
ncbi:MAG: tRNA (N6-threonylcarbamoyladenosine(37)-N6)-methyltransferase TrmO [Anaerolineales bacterium]